MTSATEVMSVYLKGFSAVLMKRLASQRLRRVECASRILS